MDPKWCRAIAFCFEKEDRRDRLNCLHEVLADQKTAYCEAWTGADPAVSIRPILFIKRHGDWCLGTFMPSSLEILSP
jgi:hypothetical protein